MTQESSYNQASTGVECEWSVENDNFMMKYVYGAESSDFSQFMELIFLGHQGISLLHQVLEMFVWMRIWATDTIHGGIPGGGGGYSLTRG